MDVTLIVAAIVILGFVGILIALAVGSPSIQDAVTADVVTRALTGPVPVTGVHARLDAPIRPAGEPEDEPT